MASHKGAGTEAKGSCSQFIAKASPPIWSPSQPPSPSVTDPSNLNPVKGFRIIFVLAHADIALDAEAGAMIIKMQLVSFASKKHCLKNT